MGFEFVVSEVRVQASVFSEIEIWRGGVRRKEHQGHKADPDGYVLPPKLVVVARSVNFRTVLYSTNLTQWLQISETKTMIFEAHGKSTRFPIAPNNAGTLFPTCYLVLNNGTQQEQVQNGTTGETGQWMSPVG